VLDREFALRIVECAEFLGWSTKFVEFQRKDKTHRPEYRVDITTQNTIEAFNEAVNDFHENYHHANQSYRLGFLGGFFDAEGTVNQGRRVSFSQKTNRKVVDILESFIKELGFEYSRHDGTASGMTDIYLRGGWRNLAKFLSLINPAIARKVSIVNGEGRSQSLRRDKVVNRYDAGQISVYNFATENGYYFANQHFVKNCDTKHSWNARRHPQRLTADLIAEAKAANPAIVVITGGEPLMYDLSSLSNGLRAAGLRVHLETSGTHPFSGSFDWVTFSPKRSKLPHESIYPQVSELKVVVADQSDLSWAEDQATKISTDAAKLLQPEWGTPDSYSLIFEYVLSHPEWRISLQTHKFTNIQ
jgi:organic radical activating enzyme